MSHLERLDETTISVNVPTVMADEDRDGAAPDHLGMVVLVLICPVAFFAFNNSFLCTRAQRLDGESRCLQIVGDDGG